MLKAQMPPVFPGLRLGCDQLFFRSYWRSATLVIFERSFLSQEELYPFQLFLFWSGHENEPLGLLSFHKWNPSKSFSTTSQGCGVPSVLDVR